MRYRTEPFGGIVANERPPFLAYVDRDFMRELGVVEDSRWQGEEPEIEQLSAPTEVHFSLTNACPNACPHCYMASGESDPGELSTERFKAALDVLADMGVFHVALGGGEALMRSDLFEIAQHARSRGLVPNLTLSGSGLTPELARRMKVFGQANFSLDGVGELSAVFRGKDLFAQVDHGIDLLRAAGVSTGINCVVGCRNFDGLPALFEYAARKGLNEVEILRYKPAGRGRAHYTEHATNDEQNIALLPRLQELSERTGVLAKIDCSFVPMLCWHNPPAELLERMATYGCEAGNVLLGARSNGLISGCSFLNDTEVSIFDLPSRWTEAPEFGRFRRWHERAPEPCRSCPYVRLCKGGCHAVAAFVTGDPDAPDPGCPRVVRARVLVRPQGL